MLTSTLQRFLISLALGVVAVACGGAVDTGDNGGAGASTSRDSTGGATGAAGSPCCGNTPSQGLLADCKPGFLAAEATDSKPCRFFVGKTCYSTQDEACACVCPRNAGAVLCVADGNQYLQGTDAYGVWCEAR